MAKHRRKRSRRHVRCVMCTQHRHGNTAEALPPRDRRKLQDKEAA